MSLLFLMGLGTVSLNAQVRIGGNAAPNASALLDLNATDATNNGMKGLALPRVNLTSNTMQLTTGVANLTGMMVYNVTATIGAVGIYVWNGNNWLKANLPTTTQTDSGLFLMSTGTSWVLSPVNATYISNPEYIYKAITPVPNISWTKVADSTLTVTVQTNTWTRIAAAGVDANDLCVNTQGRTGWFIAGPGYVDFVCITTAPVTPAELRIRCYRPSA